MMMWPAGGESRTRFRTVLLLFAATTALAFTTSQPRFSKPVGLASPGGIQAPRLATKCVLEQSIPRRRVYFRNPQDADEDDLVPVKTRSSLSSSVTTTATTEGDSGSQNVAATSSSSSATHTSSVAVLASTPPSPPPPIMPRNDSTTRSTSSSIFDRPEDTIVAVNVEECYYEPPQIVHRKRPPQVRDPAKIRFVDCDDINPQPHIGVAEHEDKTDPAAITSSTRFPFALMMQGTAPYIAAHAGEVCVFHIPGEVLLRDEDDDDNDNSLIGSKAANQLLEDMALAWLLGMKMVLVVGCRYDVDTCDFDFDKPHECHNSLKITDATILRKVEEEAGYLRTEMERQLNRCLRAHTSSSSTSNAPEAPPQGNVVSGNFYTAQRFGVVREQDFEYTGYTSTVHVENMQQVLANNDVVLLTTVGLSKLGELVNVNGYHLAASVAAALQAYKLVYMAHEGTVLQEIVDDDENNTMSGKIIQEMPLSMAQAITQHHHVQVHNTGYATFEAARQRLPSAAVELLLHLGWAGWALENGVKRAHVVNPADGALLEELFTSKNGANTCLYHDAECNEPEESAVTQEDWDEFFASAHESPPSQSTTTYN